MDVTGQNIMESCGSYRFHIKLELLIHEINIFTKDNTILTILFLLFNFNIINYTLNQIQFSWLMFAEL